jgi:hypothetical protein
MSKRLVPIACWLLAGVLAGAQDTLGSGAKPGAQDTNPPAKGQSSTAQNTLIRGCLSGSAGNFTLTDQNGMLYKLVGGDPLLQSKVGHEVEISGTGNQSGATGEDRQSVARMPNAFQVSNVRDISGNCRLRRDGNSPPPDK